MYVIITILKYCHKTSRRFCGADRIIAAKSALSVPSIESLLKNYLDYLEIEKNRSQKTSENYDRYLRKFFEFADIRTEKDITLEKVKDFRIHLARALTGRGGEFKKATQSYYVIAIRNFLKYLTKNDYDVVSPDKIELPKLPKRQIDVVEYADLERLMKAPAGSDLKSLRDRAILEVLFSTGMRVSELCSLNRYFDLARGEISIRGKGGKLRVVFLSDSAKRAVKDYLDKRGDAEEAMFISLTKAKNPKVIGRIIPRAVQRLVDFYSRKAGIPQRVHPHQIRHSFATDLLIGGADLRSVQELLGHSSVATTQIYTHLTNKELKEIHKTFHARRRR